MTDIVLKDRNGNSIEYPGVNHIKVKTTDGATRDFVDSETVPEVLEDLPIALDFSGGNQEIIAPDGMVVKSAVIQQPANLIPENIAEGVDIAGIVGALAGGSSIRIATGETKATGSPLTIEHGLGVVPDFIYFGTKANTQGTRKFLCAYGFSAAFIELTGDKLRGRYVVGEQTNFLQGVNKTVESTESSKGIFNATATTFQVAGDSNYPVATILGSNQWVAIGGLT